LATIRRLTRLQILPLAAALTAAFLVACGGDTAAPKATATPTATATPAAAKATPTPTATPSGAITVYSGRNEALIAPIIKQFSEKTGVTVNVRYGDTTALAATLLEEKDRTPADVYIAQDGGALGLVEHAGLFATLDETILAPVQPTYKSAAKQWVGLSGRARVIVYNPKNTQADTLPKSILELTDPKWKGKIGWAPANASLQSFVTALRVQQGEAKAKA
jgi:iron(III) transport system substrate-binding protein